MKVFAGFTPELIFIETLEGSFIIEPSSAPARSSLAYFLSKELKISIAPQRILSFQDQEFRQILWKVEKFTFTDQKFQKKLLDKLNKPFWILRPYKPFIPLSCLSGNNSKEYSTFY